MNHIITIDSEGNEYLEDVPGLTMEDADLSDEEICAKYGLVMPENVYYIK